MENRCAQQHFSVWIKVSNEFVQARVGIPNLELRCRKMIQLVVWIWSCLRYPSLTPDFLMNLIPTPPKNLRLFATPSPAAHDKQANSTHPNPLIASSESEDADQPDCSKCFSQKCCDCLEPQGRTYHGSGRSFATISCETNVYIG